MLRSNDNDDRSDDSDSDFFPLTNSLVLLLLRIKYMNGKQFFTFKNFFFNKGNFSVEVMYSVKQREREREFFLPR